MILRFLNRLVGLPLGLAGLILMGLMVLTFADVLARSFLNAPIPAATEVTELLLVTIVFAALPAISLRGEHISVDLLDALIPQKIIRLRDICVQLACGCLLVWPGLTIWHHGVRSLGYGERTLHLGLPLGYVTLATAVLVLISAALMVARGLLLLRKTDP